MKEWERVYATVYTICCVQWTEVSVQCYALGSPDGQAIKNEPRGEQRHGDSVVSCAYTGVRAAT